MKKGSHAGDPRQYRVVGSARGYVTVYQPEHPRANKTLGRVYEHILVVEQALGHPLRETAHVHHVNGDGCDNRPVNLVACENAAYHKLLHYRQRALDACGNANWHRCDICRRWDDPDGMRNVRTRPLQWYHVECGRLSNRARKELRP